MAIDCSLTICINDTREYILHGTSSLAGPLRRVLSPMMLPRLDLAEFAKRPSRGATRAGIMFENTATRF
jgi:hypothetical protein